MLDSWKILLPDLVSHCAFPLRTNRHAASASSASTRWLSHHGSLSDTALQAFHGLRAGRLAAMCYPDAGAPQLRVCCDFLNYLFHLDNLSDDMDSRSTARIADVVLNALYHPQNVGRERIGRVTTDYWRRMRTTAAPGTQRRFVETLDLFFQAVTQQARDRSMGIVPDLESYIELRRDTSGCKPCWALIEYANNLDIPDEVMEHPVLQSLGQATNDLVTWSNDIFSYKVEQSRNDTHNMIPVIMHHTGVSLQAAIDAVGDMCKQSIDRFIADRQLVPSWGDAEIDRQVKIYVDGLADWIVGSLHWSFESERYFGKDGKTVKQTRTLEFSSPHLLDKIPYISSRPTSDARISSRLPAVALPSGPGTSHPSPETAAQPPESASHDPIQTRLVADVMSLFTQCLPATINFRFPRIPFKPLFSGSWTTKIFFWC